MPLITAGRVVSTIFGEFIVILRQHPYHENNKTIHSSPQIEHYENKVDDRYIKVDGG